MKTSLEHIIDSLKLTEEQKSELYNNIRGFDLEDDNDPLLRISLFLSLLAKFTEEIPEKIAYERQLIELTLKEFKNSSDISVKSDIRKNTESKPAVQNNKPVSKVTYKYQKYSQYFIGLMILITLLGIVFNYFYTAKPILETYQKRDEFLKKCSNTPEIFKIKNKKGWYVTIEEGSEIKLQNSQSAAELKGYY